MEQEVLVFRIADSFALLYEMKVLNTFSYMYYLLLHFTSIHV